MECILKIVVVDASVVARWNQADMQQSRIEKSKHHRGYHTAYRACLILPWR